MPLYFPGFPASPLNSVQFNNGGAFGGDANLTWVPASGLRNKVSSFIGPDESALPVPLQGFDGTGQTLLITGVQDYNVSSSTVSIAAGPPTGWAQALAVAAFSYDDNANGGYFSGTISHTNPNKVAAGMQAAAVANGSIIVPSTTLLTPFYASEPGLYNGATAGWFVSFYAVDIGGTAGANVTNPYSFWSNEQGVFRIKSDNTFNSVYQAIPALYNPQFTKYTPGAANFERIILGQWSSNIGQVGIESGGTGTFREMQLLGNPVSVAMGLSTGRAPLVGLANQNMTPVGNVGGGEDVLITYTLPASAFSVAGKGVHITAWGITANNVNAKTLKLYFGSVILTNSLATSIAGFWRLEADVFSTGTDTQRYDSQLVTTGAAGVALNDIESGTLTEDDGATITIKCSGTATTDNDIVQQGMIVEFYN